MYDEKDNAYLDCINNVAHGNYFILLPSIVQVKFQFVSAFFEYIVLYN